MEYEMFVIEYARNYTGPSKEFIHAVRTAWERRIDIPLVRDMRDVILEASQELVSKHIGFGEFKRIVRENS